MVQLLVAARAQMVDRERPAVVAMVGVCGAITPAAIDTLGFKSVDVATHVVVGGITFDASNKVEFKLRHGDTSTASEHTAVEADDVLMPYVKAWARAASSVR